MEIKSIHNKSEWENALKNAKNVPFQQSWDWGEVLIEEGKNVERIAVVDNGQFLALAQVGYHALPFGRTYVLCPKGPIFACCLDRSAYQAVVWEIKKFLKNRNCVFFRMEPPVDFGFKILDLRLRKSIDLNPSTTTVLDLSTTADELFGNMEKKTRYSIRQAQTKGVVVKNEKNFGIFWELMKKMSERNKIKLHDRTHYETILSHSGSVQLTAYKDTVPVATALFWGYGDTFTYLFAGSNYDYHDLQAPYLIQKEAIELAKSLGFKKYDFFGVAPASKKQEIKKARSQSDYEYDRTHQYAGITKFKMGFGGEIVAMPGTFDVVLKPGSYWLYSFIRKVRRFV